MLIRNGIKRGPKQAEIVIRQLVSQLISQEKFAPAFFSKDSVKGFLDGICVVASVIPSLETKLATLMEKAAHGGGETQRFL
jgi:hypothetical protein